MLYFSIFWTELLKFSGKKYSLSLHLVEKDRYFLDADPDPEQAKMMPIQLDPDPQHC